MPQFERTQTFTHDIGTNGTLNVRTTSGDVAVEAAEGSEARVEVLYHVQAADSEAADRLLATQPVDVRRGEGSLDVEVREMRGGLLGGLGIAVGRRAVGVELHIAVPPRTDVRIHGVNSDLNLTGIGGRQDLKTVSGDVIVRQAHGELAAQSVSGDVIVSAVASIAIEASTTSGDVIVSGPLVRSSRVQSVSGDVELVGSLSPDGEHRVGTVSGDLRIGTDGGVTVEVSGLSTTVRSELEHRTESRDGRRVTIVGDGRARVTFRSMSGNVRITGPSPTRSAIAAVPATELTSARIEDASPRSVGPTDHDVPPDDLAILRALERGEIDVDEASRLLTGVSHDG
jgi:hypothetical protein